jgi:cell wall assembly regulator SMI1
MPLDQALLDRLDSHWQRLQPSWLGALSPGLQPDEAARKLEPLGLTLPPELQTWWRWHDGASAPAYLTPSCELFGLDVALKQAQMLHEVAVDFVERTGKGEPGDLWPPTYLPVFGWAGWTIATDCAVQEPSSPLFVVEPTQEVDMHALLAPSVGDLIHRWIEMYAAGYYVGDENGRIRAAGLARTIAPVNPI